MDRILSGIQPSGQLTLGNYLGAIKNWVGLQHQIPSLFCIVDLHALTVPQDPKRLAESIREVAALYIASGIDPKKSGIFVQSHVPAHSELAWLMSCITPMGWLNRMTQFKEKAGKHRENSALGLYAYPVLQAADILLYQATQVPVGEDQKQHIELARDIAASFNHRFGTDFFTLPEYTPFGIATRIMSLRDGTKKMSKSDESAYSRVEMLDDPETISLKIQKAKTDAEPLPDSPQALETRPEAKNLLTIYAVLADQSLDTVCTQFAGATFSQFKPKLADLIISVLDPIRKKATYLLSDKSALEEILKQGAAQAHQIADKTLLGVQQLMGLRPPSKD